MPGRGRGRASFTLLSNRPDSSGAPTLPLSRGIKVYLRGVGAEAASGYGTVVDSQKEADVAIVRLQASFEQRETMFENFFQAGSLDYPAEQIEDLVVLRSTVPTVTDVFLDRPAILTPLVEDAYAITAIFGTGNHAPLDILIGEASTRGADCPWTCRAPWRPSRQIVRTCRLTPLIPCSGSATSWGSAVLPDTGS